MGQRLFILLFFTGVVPLGLSVPRKYYLIQQGQTWSDAQAYCRAKHTDLAIIENDEDMVQFQNEIQRQHFSSTAWIGLYDDTNSWHWSLGHEPLGSMRPWNTNQPDNWQGNEKCGVIYGSGWSDVFCTAKFPFACFDDTKTGIQRYIYISNAMTWYEAQVYCRAHHTDLASARDATENSIVVGLTSGITWFGLFRDSWKWTDQTKFSTISWMAGEPDNAQKNENCGYINNGQAADTRCSDIMPFFCYSLHPVITGIQEAVRVKLQFCQDVNDPALKTAILEQIKQELKDHGMAENSTVKWREQPYRKVFHKETEKNTTEKN